MLAIFYYTDGCIVEREFETLDQCRASAQSEGAHLDYWEEVDD